MEACASTHRLHPHHAPLSLAFHIAHHHHQSSACPATRMDAPFSWQQFPSQCPRQERRPRPLPLPDLPHVGDQLHGCDTDARGEMGRRVMRGGEEGREQGGCCLDSRGQWVVSGDIDQLPWKTASLTGCSECSVRAWSGFGCKGKSKEISPMFCEDVPYASVGWSCLLG